jgi:hypothetical protein
MKKFFVFVGLFVLVFISGNCVRNGSSRVEEDFGTSFRLAKQNQQLNPEAAKNIDPVSGFDGKAAQATLDKYRKDFEKPTPPTPFVLSIEGVGNK